MRAVDLIADKRAGGRHTDEEIRWLIGAYLRGDVPDYQIAAWLMAVCWRGLDDGETRALTLALADSGRRLSFQGFDRPVVDKHSTGGVGDKTTLALAPMLAAAGAAVAKLSGRGLGHTGGTIDKLEAIPGVTTPTDPDAFVAAVRERGLAVAAQSPELVPGGGRLRALVAGMGGDARCVDEPERLPRAPHVVDVPSPRTAYVAGIDALGCGRAALLLGAGRATMEASIDPAVGIVLRAKTGDYVKAGESLFTVHARRPVSVDSPEGDGGALVNQGGHATRAAVEAALAAFRWSDTPVQPPRLVLGAVRSAHRRPTTDGRRPTGDGGQRSAGGWEAADAPRADWATAERQDDHLQRLDPRRGAGGDEQRVWPGDARRRAQGAGRAPGAARRDVRAAEDDAGRGAVPRLPRRRLRQPRQARSGVGGRAAHRRCAGAGGARLPGRARAPRGAGRPRGRPRQGAPRTARVGPGDGRAPARAPGGRSEADADRGTRAG